MADRDKRVFEESQREFTRAHDDGMRSLTNREFDTVRVAIARERAAIEKASAAIKSATGDKDHSTAEQRDEIAAQRESDNEERERLTERMDALEREHRELMRKPHATGAHRQHREHLQEQIARLRARRDRLRLGRDL